jgi:hypothetical protein
MGDVSCSLSPLYRPEVPSGEQVSGSTGFIETDIPGEWLDSSLVIRTFCDERKQSFPDWSPVVELRSVERARSCPRSQACDSVSTSSANWSRRRINNTNSIIINASTGKDKTGCTILPYLVSPGSITVISSPLKSYGLTSKGRWEHLRCCYKRGRDFGYVHWILNLFPHSH